jgi:ferredoxin
MEFFFLILEDEERLISCKKNIPCISILNVEHLISMALASDEPITLDLGHCRSCKIKEPLYEQILINIEEANFILSSFGDKQLLSEDLAYQPMEVESDNDIVSSRRSFLSNISLDGVVKHKEAFDKAVNADEQMRFEIDDSVIAKIKERRLPDKRKILFTTLKRATKPDRYEVLPQEEVSFTSQKFIDESCTNCQICYRICPTGALSSDSKSSLINFDAMLCLKCRLCHDVCEPNAIQLQGGFEIIEFFEPTQRTLAIFDIKRCKECGSYFTYQGGEMICPRCVAEEDEARSLHQNTKDINF